MVSLKTVQLVKFFLKVYFSKLLRSRNIRLSLSYGFKKDLKQYINKTATCT